MTDTLTMLFAGDFYPCRRTAGLIAQGKHDAVYGNGLDVLRSNDLALVNLECPLTTGGRAIKKSGPNMRAHPDAAVTVRRGGFDVACLANNHIGDFGGPPVVETLEHLSKQKVRTVGAGANLADASKTLFVRKKGHRVAFLAFAENEFSCADEENPGAWPLNPIANIRAIAQARAKADFVIVVCHAGNEHNPVPSPRMVQLYRAFADAGASAVIGMHPHTPQGWEIHNDTPIFYSVGNFLFDVERPRPLWPTGYMPRLSFSAPGRRPTVEIIPYSAHPETAVLTLLDGKMREDFLDYLQTLCDPIGSDAEIARYWAGWCALRGPEWATYFRHAAGPWKTAEEKQGMLVARNALMCEAHHEVLCGYYELVRKRRLADARKTIPEIEKLTGRSFPAA